MWIQRFDAGAICPKMPQGDKGNQSNTDLVGLLQINQLVDHIAANDSGGLIAEVEVNHTFILTTI